MIRIYSNKGQDITEKLNTWNMKDLMLLKKYGDIKPKIDGNSLTMRYIKRFIEKGVNIPTNENR